MSRAWFSRHRLTIIAAAILVAMLLTGIFVVRPDFAGIAAILLSWAVPCGALAFDKWEKVESLGGRALVAFGFVSSRAERVGIAADMQGQLNGARRELEGELEGALPHPLRVKFVRNPAEVASLSEGEVVIALGDHRKRSQNVARAALAYTSTDLIRPARPYLDPTALKSLDLAVAKRLLLATDTDALNYFLNDVYSEALDSDNSLRELCSEVEGLERNGVLSRILLTEYLELGRRLFPGFPPPGVQSATREFVHHMYRIVTKRYDEDLGPGLMFTNGHLKVGVVLVADREMAEKKGVRPYVWRTLDDIKKGCTSVYLLAKGSRRSLLPEIVRELEGNGRILSIDDPSNFLITSDGGNVEASLVRVVADQRGYHDRAVRTDPLMAEIPVAS